MGNMLIYLIVYKGKTGRDVNGITNLVLGCENLEDAKFRLSCLKNSNDELSEDGWMLIKPYCMYEIQEVVFLMSSETDLLTKFICDMKRDYPYKSTEDIVVDIQSMARMISPKHDLVSTKHATKFVEQLEKNETSVSNPTWTLKESKK